MLASIRSPPPSPPPAAWKLGHVPCPASPGHFLPPFSGAGSFAVSAAGEGHLSLLESLECEVVQSEAKKAPIVVEVELKVITAVPTAAPRRSPRLFGGLVVAAVEAALPRTLGIGQARRTGVTAIVTHR